MFFCNTCGKPTKTEKKSRTSLKSLKCLPFLINDTVLSKNKFIPRFDYKKKKPTVMSLKYDFYKGNVSLVQGP